MDSVATGPRRRGFQTAMSGERAMDSAATGLTPSHDFGRRGHGAGAGRRDF